MEARTLLLYDSFTKIILSEEITDHGRSTDAYVLVHNLVLDAILDFVKACDLGLE